MAPDRPRAESYRHLTRPDPNDRLVLSIVPSGSEADVAPLKQHADPRIKKCGPQDQCGSAPPAAPPRRFADIASARRVTRRLPGHVGDLRGRAREINPEQSTEPCTLVRSRDHESTGIHSYPKVVGSI